MAIHSFRHRGLKRFFRTGDSRGLSPNRVPKIRVILADLAVARTSRDMDRMELSWVWTSWITPEGGDEMEMFDPPHPGESIRWSCLEPCGLTVTAAAEILGVTRKALSELLNGHSGVSPEMAIRLSRAFGSSPEHWLRLQMQHDLWRARQRMGEIERQTRPDGLAPDDFPDKREASS